MDWNNVNVFEMEEGVNMEASNFFVQPQHAPGTTVAMVSSASSSENASVIGVGGGASTSGSSSNIDSSNVVFRTLEGFEGEDDGVEVIGILEEGMLQNLNQMGVTMTNEEFYAQLQSQGILQGGHQIEEQCNSEAVIVQGVLQPPQDQEEEVMEGNLGEVVDAEQGQEGAGSVIADEKVEVEEMQIGSIDAPTQDSNMPVHIQEEPVAGPSSSSASAPIADVKVFEESSKSPESILPDPLSSTTKDVANDNDNAEETPTSSASLPPKTSSSSPKEKRVLITSRPPLKPEEPSVVVMDAATGETVAVIDNSPQKRKKSSPARTAPTPSKKSSEDDDKLVEIIISSDEDNDDEDFSLLNDVDISEMDPELVLISSDEDDEEYISDMQNAIALQKLRQSVDISLQSYRPKLYSRELMHKKHPKCKDLSFKEIMQQALLEEKVLPDLNEQQLSKPVVDRLRALGHRVERKADGGLIIYSKNGNTKVYYSQNSARFEPVLTDPILENYVQVFRKSIARRMAARQEVDPSSVIPASIGSTGSSSIGSETDPECLATDEEESESELLQGSVAAWIIPDSIPSRTPSPEPDFDEPQFITTTTTAHHHHHHPTVVGSHQTTTIVEGPPTKKRKQKHHEPKPHTDGKIYPKPAFSYSCLIAMALKNSKTGSLPVSEIYKFMCDHFPYFKSAPSGWKNSVRHNLSLNKCFEKIEKPGNNGARKGCLWALNPAKIHKMDEEVQKWSRKDPLAIRRAMSDPENLGLIEKGELKRDYSGTGSDDDEDEDFSEPATPLTPGQVQARRSRTNSSDSTLEGATAVVTPVVTTVSQVHAALQRSLDAKSQIQVKREDNSVDLGTITNIQGNYVCHTPTGNGTYTLSFANIGSSSPLTPIIIRRTPTVK